MLAGSRLAHAQFGVLAATPMDRKDDLARIVVHVDDDIGDQGPQQLLACAHRDAGAFQAADRLFAKLVKTSGSTVMSDRFSVGWRVSRSRTRRSAASQFFSSCAAIRRLSGSQAA